MKMHRALCSLMLLVATGAMTGQSLAQTTAAAGSTTTTTTATGEVVNVTVVPVSGTVQGGAGVENVVISGNVQMTCVMVKDPDFKTPTSMRHVIDFVGVTGKGAKSGALYVVPDVDVKIRPMVASDTIQMTFPFFLSTAGMMTARAGLATFTVSANASGKVTGITGTIGTPAF